jgi:mannose-1-phosphate guanylyltransferase
MNVYSVILAGGSGTRFWPLSRVARPKQFLPLVTRAPLLVDTVRRISKISTLKQTYVSCGPSHARTVRRLLKAIPAGNILVEPVARNTAPAIGLAAVHVASREPNGVLQVLPADHAVRDVDRFRACLTAAGELAAQGMLVTLGIRPTRPETGYGYIEVGEGLGFESFRAKAFVEKPDAPTARGYIESGKFFWNAGIFVFRADAILGAFAKHMPELAEALARIARAIGKRGYQATVSREFRKLPPVSIDYGVMERAGDNLAVIPGDFGWSDLGSFASLPEVRARDARGNVVSGPVGALVDCDNCVVFAGKRPLALAGLSDIVVIDAGDVLLVVPKQKSQDVRKVVEAFRTRALKRFL